MTDADEINKLGVQLDLHRAGAAVRRRGKQLRLLRLDPMGQGVAIVEAKRAIAELDRVKFNVRGACRAAAWMLRIANDQVEVKSGKNGVRTLIFKGGWNSEEILMKDAGDIRSLVRGIQPEATNKRRIAFAANRLWAAYAALPWVFALSERSIEQLQRCILFQYMLNNDEYVRSKFDLLKYEPEKLVEFFKLYSGSISFWDGLR